MDPIDLRELPIEKEFSENINRKMQIPQSITYTSDEMNIINRMPNRSLYDTMKCPQKISADFLNVHDNNYKATKGHMATHECDWPIIPLYGKGTGIEMSPPPRKLCAANSIPHEETIKLLASQHLAQNDPHEGLFDSNDKLRKQIFKLNRRLTTLEKETKDEREKGKLFAIAISCVFVAHILFSTRY